MKEGKASTSPPPSAGSGEPIRRRGNRTTRIPEIVEGATRVFRELGDAGFTQRRVAAEVGIQLSTLQHYFVSREALLKVVIEKSAGDHLEEIRGIVSNARLAADKRLERFVEHTFRALSGLGNVISPFAIECWALSERHTWMAETMRWVSDEYLTLFTRLVSHINPSLSVADADLRGAMLYSHWQGLIVFLRRTTFGKRRPRAIETLTVQTWLAVAYGQV